MNKIGLHVCYLRGTEYEMDYAKSMPLVKANGCDVLELSTANILRYSKNQRNELKRMSKDLDLELTLNGGLSAQTDISSDDPAVRRKGIEYLQCLLQTASETGIQLFSGVNYISWLSRPKALLTQEVKRRAWHNSVVSMRSVIRAAECLGILVCFEVVNRYEQYLLNTAQQGVEYAESIGSPNAGILLDSFHMNIEEDNMLDSLAYAMKSKRLKHIHVGESNRRIPGVGASNINWSGFFSTLKEFGYAARIVIEPFVKMGLETSMNTSVWRDLSIHTTINESMRDVKNGIAFIRDQLSG